MPVASGLTGQVFRARQPSTDRLVAVKVAGVAVLDPALLIAGPPQSGRRGDFPPGRGIYVRSGEHHIVQVALPA